MADKIEIQIDGKDNTSHAFKSASSGLGSLVKTAAGFATGMGVFSLASSAVGGFGNVVKDAITSSQDEQAVMAQTNAAIKSTGDASGLSAKQIADMANALQDQTTYGNEAIQSGENLLLTFTNIGKDTFPVATQAMLDLSTATGQDMKSSAIQLGKALNDPVQGVTALQRVGVSFTDQQKQQIQTMVKTGDTMGAQKLILGELNKEFGGSATAATKSFGGQMAQLKNQIGDAEKALSYALLPVLARLAQRVVPVLVKAIEWLGRVAPPAIQWISDKATALWSMLSGPFHAAWVMVRDAVITFIEALQGNWTDNSKIEGVHRVIGNLGLVIRNDVIPAFMRFFSFAQKHWKQILTVIEPVWSFLIQFGQAVSKGGLLGGLKAIPNILHNIFSSFKTVLGGLLSYVTPILKRLGRKFIDWIKPQIVPLLTELGNLLGQLAGWLKSTALPAIVKKLGEWGKAFIDWVGPQIPPLLAELGKLLEQLGGWLKDTALPKLIEKLGEWGTAFVEWVGPKIPKLIDEMFKLEGKLIGWILFTAIPDIVPKIAELAAKFVEWVATDVVPKIPGAMQAIADKLSDFVVTTLLPWAGSALLTVGKAIIQGLIDGIGEMVKPLKDKLSGITDLIPSWKGPLDKDLKLLFGSGVAIMTGLIGGIESQRGQLQNTLRQITNQIATSGMPQLKTINGNLYYNTGNTAPNGNPIYESYATTQQMNRRANVHQLILDGKVIWDSVASHQETNARTRISAFGAS